MKKKSKICFESQLVHEFHGLIREDKNLSFVAIPDEELSNKLSCVQLAFDGRKEEFKIHYSLKPSVQELAGLVNAEKSKETLLIVSPRLSPRVIDFCRAHELSAIDLNGRAYLRTTGLLVDRSAHPGRNFRFELEPKDIFAGKSGRIIRSLLAHSGKVWVQSELVVGTGASSGLVSRIITHLVDEGLVCKLGTRQFRVQKPVALLDDWADSDNIARRCKTLRYSSSSGSAAELISQITKFGICELVKVCFTQWAADWLRRGGKEPPYVSAYISEVPIESRLASFGIHPVSEDGDLLLFLPDDEGVFFETSEIEGVNVVSDAQIYLDLLKCRPYGQETAVGLRNWPNFCRI